ncbi:hypothetical protein FACS1894186_6110 [Alphaproteobacteria bacterium]|nr:hypothetical protein FACS1894186_6110 [Alphaproteobacteria bacterium]
MLDSLINSCRRFKPVAKYKFKDTQHYWERRYRKGRSSGTVGAFDQVARFKADFLADFIKEHSVASVIDFGCGDGMFLTYCRFPKYDGYETSATALSMCREFFAEKAEWNFHSYADYRGEKAELALSLDVVNYIVEDDAYLKHLRDLFAAGTRYVTVFAADEDSSKDQTAEHFRLRRFTDWVADNVRDCEQVAFAKSPFPHLSAQSFHIYAKKDAGVVQR